VFLKGIATLLLCIVLAALSSLALNYYTRFCSPNYWLSLCLFTLLFLVLNLFYNAKSDFKAYSQVLIGTISVKLLILLVAIFLYSLWDNTGLFNFFMHFSAHYILFTVFEIRYLLHIINNRPKHTL
jgi:hypothetical protein